MPDCQRFRDCRRRKDVAGALRGHLTLASNNKACPGPQAPKHRVDEPLRRITSPRWGACCRATTLR